MHGKDFQQWPTVQHVVEKSMERTPKLVSAALVLNDQGEVFLGRCPKFNYAWIAPGGHIEPGEDPADAAVREVWEELGVRVGAPTYLKFHEWFSPDYKQVGALFHCHNYAVVMHPGQEITINDEYDDYVFLSPEEALEVENLHPTARMIIEYYLESKNER